ncbi:hypothetical protein CYY_006117 [Polysphondylium violaceum]|uniref:Uncharacterized protein n=1 Tax=Polysphondylium violaceum TaxID=133409 RepID=A0A8J4UZ70_9MYCE|nr:hypothetical protein CYY_006117 [Polysphondylium violaceum]
MSDEKESVFKRLDLIFNFLFQDTNDHQNNDDDHHNHDNHHSSDETRFEKIFDRLKSIIDSSNALFIEYLIENDVVARDIEIINNRYKKRALVTTTTDFEYSLLSANIRLLGLFFQDKQIYQINKDKIKQILEMMFQFLLVHENPLIRNRSLVSINSIVLSSGSSDSNNQQSPLFLLDLDTCSPRQCISTIFQSFQYPSTFVSHSATILMSTLFINSFKNNYSNNIEHDLPLIILKLVEESIQQQQQQKNETNLVGIKLNSDSLSVDTILCILDFMIQILEYLFATTIDSTPDQQQTSTTKVKIIEFFKSSNLVHKLSSLVLDQNRLVQSRAMEMISIISNFKSTPTTVDSLAIIDFFTSMKGFYKSIIQKLVLPLSEQTLNKSSLCTAIDLIGTLDNTFLFPLDKDSKQPLLFQQLNILVQILYSTISTTPNNNDISVPEEVYLFHIFQATKEILKKSNGDGEYPIFSSSWIEFLVFVSTLKAKFYSNVSVKTLKECLHCLKLLHIDQWISIFIQDNNSFNFNSNNNSSKQNSIYFLMKNQSKYSRFVLKESLDVFLENILPNYQYVRDHVTEFDSLFVDMLSSLLMNPSSDVRDQCLIFISNIFKNQQLHAIQDTLFNYSIGFMVLKKLVDSDNYVRSSTLDTIKIISTISYKGWSHLCEEKDESIFKNADQLHLIIKETPSLTINDDLCNNNQINLKNYTNLLEKERKESKNHLFYEDTISMGSIEDKGASNDLIQDEDWEWDDQEFKELCERNRQEPINFMQEYDNEINMNNDENSSSIQFIQESLNYKFPHSILLFLNDEDSYPRISALEVLISWLKESYSFEFLQSLINDPQENEKYRIQSIFTDLMGDNGYWEVKSKCIEFFESIYEKEISINNQELNMIQNLNVETLLLNNIISELEDKIIIMKSLALYQKILNWKKQIKNLNTTELQNKVDSVLNSLYDEFTEEEQEDIYLFSIEKNDNSNNKEDNNAIDCY